MLSSSCGLCLRPGEATIRRIHARFQTLIVYLTILLEKIDQRAKRAAKLSGNKITGKQWTAKEEPRKTTRLLSQSDGNRMSSTEIRSWPMDGQKNIADTWTTSRRSTSIASQPGSRGTGTRAPSRWRVTKRIVKLDL